MIKKDGEEEGEEEELFDKVTIKSFL